MTDIRSHRPTATASDTRGGHARVRALLATVAGALAVLALAASPAAAGLPPDDVDPQGYDIDTLSYLFFYDAPADGIVVTVGGPATAWCTGDPSMVDGRTRVGVDGGFSGKVRAPEQSIFVYAFDGIAPQLVDETCAALFDGDATTEPVAPLATGEGRLKVTETVDTDGVVWLFNGVNGFAASPDGTQWKVRTWADFGITPDGDLIGDPAEFQGAMVTEIRR